MFDNLASLIYKVSESLLSVSIKKMLLGAGLGLGTYTGISKLLDKMISDANAMLASGDGTVLSLLGLTGIDIALSIILSACVVRATITSSSLFLTTLKD